MRKRWIAVLAFCFIWCQLSTCLAEVSFDISVFEGNSEFAVEFDDMNDTGEISLADGTCLWIGTAPEDDGDVIGTLDIKIVEGFPPVLRLILMYVGEEWSFVDNVIIKPAEKRYTFSVDRDTDVKDGKIYEFVTIVLTDESIGLLEDIINGNLSSVRFRWDGDRDVDGNFLIDCDQVKLFYDAYIESGAMNNNFAALRELSPCVVK